MAKLNRKILAAIAAGQYMYWQRVSQSWSVQLRAVTWTYENGREISRRLWVTWNLDEAAALMAAIIEAGGQVDTRSFEDVRTNWEDEKAESARQIQVILG